MPMGLRLAALAAGALAAAGCAQVDPCSSPLRSCSGQCIDVATSALDCGACGHACTAGRVCVAGTCVTSPNAPCTQRAGGAFVTLGAIPPCATATVKVWATNPAFVARAAALAADPASAGPDVPLFDLVAGADCDAQWTWHEDAATATFQDAASGVCDACPDDIQQDATRWITMVGHWCPSASRVRVLLVDPRP
ncbi:MAG TPA: hypothetical protein VLU43_15310 [Anaeromyxobacteraceae bacterium]|nr:hypothetical protein [Anaeromyxobacteraceae bacterium]